MAETLKVARAELVGVFGYPVDENRTGIMQEAAFAAARETFLKEDGLFFYRGSRNAARSDFDALARLAEEMPPPCRMKREPPLCPSSPSFLRLKNGWSMPLLFRMGISIMMSWMLSSR